MELETAILIEAPPPVVFRFYAQLDHLRFISSVRRREWCETRGLERALGAEREVQLQQGRHHLVLRFRTVLFEPDARYEDEFLSWPLKGARHVQTFTQEVGGTRVADANFWEPPWFVRSFLARHQEEQRALFQEKARNAKRLVEAVFALRGEEAFRGGIYADAEAAGFKPLIA